MKLKNTEVRIENTSKCNANCIICPRDKFVRKKTTMDNKHFEDLVKQSVKLGAETISIFGYGEPLCDPDIVDKVQMVTDSGLESFITTNAALLTTDLSSRLVGAGLSHIRFSAHGLWDNYERVHRGLKFSKFMRNVFNYIAISRGKSIKSVSVIPLFGENIEDIKEFWEDRVDFLEIWRPHNWTTGRNYRGITVEKKKTCGRPKNGPVQIQADGKMVVCCFDYNGELEVGDTNIDTIETIMKGDKYNSIRDKHEKGDLGGLICDVCDQRNISNTNPLLYSSRDPECNIGVTSSTKFKLEEN
jgi:aerobic-type carbon monoxide dehydrogenase small subunit (CoxS/CutS family)